MDTLREVVIDEARWPRMFAKLRRAGYYASCGCAGCKTCDGAARRFTLGLARTSRRDRGQVQGQPSRWTGHFGRNRMGFLIDDSVPALVDVQPQASLPEDAGEEQEGNWVPALRGRAVWPPSYLAPVVEGVPQAVHGTAVSSFSWRGPIPLHQYQRLPKTRGLYLIVWPNGAYLGSATSSEGLRGRVRDHRNNFYKMNYNHPLLQIFEYRVYYLELGSSDEARTLEVRYLNAIIGQPLATPLAGTAARQDLYARQGFRNLAEF